MIIRSITFFCNINDTGILPEKTLKEILAFQQKLKKAFGACGHQVQSVRLATNTFCDFLPLNDYSTGINTVQNMANSVKEFGIDYLSIGPALPAYPESYALIPKILQETDTVFATGMIADEVNGIDLNAVRACADVIVELGKAEVNGFGNLFFAALSNVPGGIPFLPAAYQDRGGNGFALAVEAADLAIAAFSAVENLLQAKKRYIENVETAARQMEKIIREVLARDTINEFEFYGFDLTPAPYITAERSVGTALEILGGLELGQHGSLAVSAFLMDALDSADFRRSGFNGLMLPVLEDAVLARNVEQGHLSIKDLLLWSAVCGTGLDTIPIPGDTSAEQIAAVLLDIGSLSARLHKPLTARLMPIPGKRAGDRTSFDFPYFVNTKVMPVESSGFSGLFGNNQCFQIFPRK